jgi:hypothetical protein
MVHRLILDRGRATTPNAYVCSTCRANRRKKPKANDLCVLLARASRLFKTRELAQRYETKSVLKQRKRNGGCCSTCRASNRRNQTTPLRLELCVFSSVAIPKLQYVAIPWLQSGGASMSPCLSSSSRAAGLGLVCRHAIGARSTYGCLIIT